MIVPMHEATCCSYMSSCRCAIVEDPKLTDARENTKIDSAILPTQPRLFPQ
jgi:hypothetical protein